MDSKVTSDAQKPESEAKGAEPKEELTDEQLAAVAAGRARAAVPHESTARARMIK